jgi:hypothetical protein
MNIKARLERLNKQAQERMHSATIPKAMAEVKAYVDEFSEQFNSEPERQKRAAEYAEVQRIGELRKQAFLNGESMDKYPLPFEKEKEGELLWQKISLMK